MCFVISRGKFTDKNYLWVIMIPAANLVGIVLTVTMRQARTALAHVKSE